MRTGSWVENMYGCDCGAPDCEICHPEYQEGVTCCCCGETVKLYDMVDDDICWDCDQGGAHCCEDCGEWGFDYILDEEYNIYYCPECYDKLEE